MRHSAKRPQPILAIAAVLCMAATLTACTGSGPSQAPPTSPTGPEFPVTVGSLTLTKRPERIVSLSPTATEMLFAIDAGSQVIAADERSDYPPQAPTTTLSGFTPNAEAIAAYQPDLVVLTYDTQDIVAQLTALQIPVFVTPGANTLDDVYQQIEDLATLTGHAPQAEALVAQMQADIEKLVADLPVRAKPLTYYYELDPMYYSVTSNTFVGTLFKSAGLVNIADAVAPSGNDWPQLSAEAIVKANPDLIFLADTLCCGQSAQTVAERDGWSEITAVKTGRVIPLNDDIASRWGPRVVDLLRAIVDAVVAVPVA